MGAGRDRTPQLTSLSGLPEPGHHTKGRIQTCSLGAPQTWTLVASWSQRDNRQGKEISRSLILRKNHIRCQETGHKEGGNQGEQEPVCLS